MELERRRKQSRKTEEGGKGRQPRPLLPFTRALFPAYEPSLFHVYLCQKLTQFLRDVEAEKSPRMLLTVPPRHGKSEMGSVHFPAWVLGEHPDWPLIHVSYTAELSNEFSRKVRNLLREPVYQELYPGVKIAQDSRSVSHWSLAPPHRGVFTSAGVGGPITGRGGKIVIIDDPVKNRQDADSELFRKMQRDWYGSTLYTRLEKGAGILLIMTRWHVEDLGGYVTTGAGADEVPVDAARWEVVNLPALCEKAEGDPLGRAPGEALWPDKYPVSVLENYQGTLTGRDWLSLYQCSPVAAQGNMLHVGRVRPLPRKVPEHLAIVQGWDLAISEKTTADYTVGFTLGLDTKTNDLYLLDCERGRWDFNGVLARIDLLARKWRPMAIALETNSFQAAVLQEARRRFLHPFMAIKATRDKVTRATLLADRIDADKCLADHSAPWWRVFEAEALAFPSGGHDDMVDAISTGMHAYAQLKQWRTA
jgi:predicted phage terminase large subunit-like protein